MLGCTYANSSNFDAAANTDDGTCSFELYLLRRGCTYEVALNYDSLAEFDDGSCTFFPSPRVPPPSPPPPPVGGPQSPPPAYLYVNASETLSLTGEVRYETIDIDGTVEVSGTTHLIAGSVFRIGPAGRIVGVGGGHAAQQGQGWSGAGDNGHPTSATDGQPTPVNGGR